MYVEMAKAPSLRSMSPVGVSLSLSLMAVTVMMLMTQIEEASESALEAADDVSSLA